ncbi:MAG: glycosyltransferase family 4 protein [Proteobacteria bacterium]|nr:glycosyltransferase family 4 protein [Pseudomonadota bacterium]MBU1740988.1 glycosyltransferase family 4 protein [Pseudomonadota bacterium]
MRIAYPFGEHLDYDRARFFQTARTVSGLAQAGCRVDFIVGRTKGLEMRLEELGLEGDPNLKVIPVAMRQPGPGDVFRISANKVFFRATLKVILKAQVDLVFSRHPKLSDYLIKKGLGRRLVHEIHEIAWRMAKHTGSPEKHWRRLKDREVRVARAAAGLVCTSPGLADFVKHELAPGAEVLVAPNPMAPGFFVERQEAAGPPRVIYVGQFFPWKGLDLLIEAFGGVREARLIVLGGEAGTDDWQRIEDLIRKLNLEARVELHGFVPQSEVIDEVSRATVAVVPAPGQDEMSREFTSPLKLFEYLAAGAPVVAADVPSINQLLGHKAQALLVPPDDPLALARGINRLLEDQDLASRLGEAGRNWARAHTPLERGRNLKLFFSRLLGE